MGAGNHKFTLPSSLLAQLCLFMFFGLFDSLLFVYWLRGRFLPQVLGSALVGWDL